MKKIWAVWIIVSCLFPAGFLGKVYGQYDLTEVGLLGGGGVSASVPGDYAADLGANLNGFYSFWFCGKNRGIHGSLGLRHGRFYNNGLIPAGSHQINVTWLDAGFFFKIRAHEYHRKKEAFLMAGPKLNFRIAEQNNASEMGINGLPESTSPFLAGVNLSGNYRMLVGSQFLWAQLGAEYYPTPFYSGPSGKNENSLYAYLNLGITVWNSKQKSYKRK